MGKNLTSRHRDDSNGDMRDWELLDILRSVLFVRHYCTSFSESQSISQSKFEDSSCVWVGGFENRGAVVLNEDVEMGFCWKGSLAISDYPMKPWLVVAGFPILEDLQ